MYNTIPFVTFMNVDTLSKAQIVLTNICKMTRGVFCIKLQSSLNVCTIPVATTVWMEMCEKDPLLSSLLLYTLRVDEIVLTN